MQETGRKTVTLVLGGVRSGKSRWALELAANAARVTYIATALVCQIEARFSRAPSSGAKHVLCRNVDVKQHFEPHSQFIQGWTIFRRLRWRVGSLWPAHWRCEILKGVVSYLRNPHCSGIFVFIRVNARSVLI